jgi:hypothetical protein
MVWFPTVDWFEQFKRALNRNPKFAELDRGWGVGWNGDMILHLTDVPIDRYRLNDLPSELIVLDRMPQDIWDDIPDETERRMRNEHGGEPVHRVFSQLDDEILSSLPPYVVDLLRDTEALFEDDPTYEDVPDVMSSDIRQVLPDHLEDLLQQMEDFVDEERNVYAFMSIRDGEVLEIDILDSPHERDAGFLLRGSYWHWEKFVEGVDVVEAVLRGELDPVGDMTRLLSYTDALQEMGDTAAAIETDYLFRAPEHGDEEQDLADRAFAEEA